MNVIAVSGRPPGTSSTGRTETLRPPSSTIDEGAAISTGSASTSGKFAAVHYIFSAVVLRRFFLRL